MTLEGFGVVEIVASTVVLATIIGLLIIAIYVFIYIRKKNRQNQLVGQKDLERGRYNAVNTYSNPAYSNGVIPLRNSVATSSEYRYTDQAPLSSRLSAKYDFTLSAGLSGKITVASCLHKLETSGMFSPDYGLLWQTMNLNQEDEAMCNTPGGIWGITLAGFEKTRTNKGDKEVSDMHKRIADLYGIYWPTVLYEDLQIPFYSCLAARILLRMHNQGKVLPESEKEQITILRNIRTDMAGRPRRGDPMNDTNSSSSGSVDGLGCPFDMAILLGVSPKCGENFQVLKSFMNRFAALIHQRSNHNRLSIILYSDRVIKMTNINESLQTSMKQLQENLRETEFKSMAGNLHTGKGLLAARRELENGRKTRSFPKASIILLIADLPAQDPYTEEATRCYQSGIILQCLVIGNRIPPEELRQIACLPTRRHIQKVQSYKSMDKVTDMVLNTATTAHIQLFPGNEVKTRLEPENVQYYVLDAKYRPVEIELQGRGITGYMCVCFPCPSPVLYDVKIAENEPVQIPNSSRKTYIAIYCEERETIDFTITAKFSCVSTIELENDTQHVYETIEEAKYENEKPRGILSATRGSASTRNPSAVSRKGSSRNGSGKRQVSARNGSARRGSGRRGSSRRPSDAGENNQEDAYEVVDDEEEEELAVDGEENDLDIIDDDNYGRPSSDDGYMTNDTLDIDYKTPALTPVEDPERYQLGATTPTRPRAAKGPRRGRIIANSPFGSRASIRSERQRERPRTSRGRPKSSYTRESTQDREFYDIQEEEDGDSLTNDEEPSAEDPSSEDPSSSDQPVEIEVTPEMEEIIRNPPKKRVTIVENEEQLRKARAKSAPPKSPTTSGKPKSAKGKRPTTAKRPGTGKKSPRPKSSKGENGSKRLRTAKGAKRRPASSRPASTASRSSSAKSRPASSPRTRGRPSTAKIKKSGKQSAPRPAAVLLANTPRSETSISGFDHVEEPESDDPATRPRPNLKSSLSKKRAVEPSGLLNKLYYIRSWDDFFKVVGKETVTQEDFEENMRNYERNQSVYCVIQREDASGKKTFFCVFDDFIVELYYKQSRQAYIYETCHCRVWDYWKYFQDYKATQQIQYLTPLTPSGEEYDEICNEAICALYDIVLPQITNQRT